MVSRCCRKEVEAVNDYYICSKCHKPSEPIVSLPDHEFSYYGRMGMNDISIIPNNYELRLNSLLKLAMMKEISISKFILRERKPRFSLLGKF